MATYRLIDDILRDFRAILKDLDTQQANFRLWAKDKTLFTSKNEDQFLDWLLEPQRLSQSLSYLYNIRDEYKAHNFSGVVLLGMGGSSLSPTVFKAELASASPFHILDTIHPRAIKRLLKKIHLPTTLFIVASKSGTTLEPLLLYRFFLAQLIAAKVTDPFAHFMAITDPITPLEQEASENGFLRGPFGEPGIGGRFSGLSVFGIMPALLMGINVENLLSSAIGMAMDTAPSIPAADNPGAMLAAFFAAGFRHGRDKVVFHLSPSISTLGLWLEQLLAESLGKLGQGLVPLIGDHKNIDLTSTMHVIVNRNDEKEPDFLPENVPVFYIDFNDAYDVAALMFLFQVATALFASIVKINPFDQPDVEKSKLCTTAILNQLKSGKNVLPKDPTHKIGDIDFYGDAHQFFKRFKQNDYCALLAFVDETLENKTLLIKLKNSIEQKTSLPVMLEFGPRYLHSVGQLFKGGKNNGHFIVITENYDEDCKSAENNLMFSQIHFGQALGDINALSESNRNVLHLHFNKELKSLRAFITFIESL